MAKADKLLAAMRNNPEGDWTIEDVATLCRAWGVACKAPSSGSHYKLRHPAVLGRLTIPARKPIKRVYIVELIKLIDKVQQA